ncbi:hypothetical protein AHAS_Ahas02G0012200 [Arachis hypogaea]
MPRKMSKLNQLHILSYFVVGKHKDNGIQELGGLENLHGSVEIKKLENIVDVNEAKRAKIMDMKHIDELCLQWSSGDDLVSSTQQERDMLDNLQPQNGLKELRIWGYKGTIFPDWCSKLEALPRDMKSLLPSLQSLEINGCPNLCRLPEGGLPPNLRSLEVGICEQQMRDLSWVANLHALTHLTISGYYCDNIKSYPELAWDQMQNPVKEFVSKLQPDWIICDFHAHWTVEIAQELHVKLMYYSVYSASTIVFFGPPGRMRAPTLPEVLTSPREWVNFPSSVAFQRNEAIAFYQSAYIENVTGLRDIDRIASVIDSANALSFRSCYEMEGEYLNLYQELIEKPVIPVGLLPPEMPERRIVDESWSKTFEWLDAQATKSVVFVGFGSECKLSKDQVFEIAYGLELSELPFLWTLRKPSWAIHDHDSLPLGFCERTSKRGKLHILSKFVVGKQEDNGIQELGGLLNLHGSLEIEKLENVVDANEARSARIIDKKHIDKLLLKWSLSSGDDIVSNTHTDEQDILWGLQPHTGLKQLTVDGYKGCPNICRWPEGGLPANLKDLSVGDCEEQVRGLSWLGNLDNLTHLTISDHHSVSRIKSYPEHEDNGIQELGGLVNLHGSVEIKKLENIVDVNEAKRAKIVAKKHIDELSLKWCSGDDMVSSTQKERDILDNLKPQSGMKELKIEGYKGCQRVVCRLT